MISRHHPTLYWGAIGSGSYLGGKSFFSEDEASDKDSRVVVDGPNLCTSGLAMTGLNGKRKKMRKMKKKRRRMGRPRKRTRKMRRRRRRTRRVRRRTGRKEVRGWRWERGGGRWQWKWLVNRWLLPWWDKKGEIRTNAPWKTPLVGIPTRSSKTLLQPSPQGTGWSESPERRARFFQDQSR